MRGLAVILLTLSSMCLAQNFTPRHQRTHSVPPAYTFVQFISPVSNTFTGSITPHGTTGHIMVIGAYFYNCTLTSATTVTDSQGNTWTSDQFFYFSFNNSSYQIWHTIPTATSADSLTVHGGCAQGNFGTAEYTGVSTFDVAGTASSTVFSDPSITLTTNHGGELCMGEGDLGANTPTTGFTERAGSNWLDGPSTGTSTTYGSVGASGWGLVGACYK